MATSYPITDQKYLNISFALAVNNVELGFFTFPIKPEELTRNEPSRVSAVNSLGGAWVDSFGRGLSTITISGNTGWRDKAGQGDGIAQFTKLRNEFIHYWHDLRGMMITSGMDPSGIRLIFIDPLNGKYVADVVPTNFTLRRSKSQPLLLMYNISMLAVNDKAVNPYPKLMEPMLPKKNPDAAIKSLSSAMKVLEKIQKSIKGFMDTLGGIAAAVRNWTQAVFGPVMALANEVIKTANAIKGVISAAGQIVVNLAADLCAVGAKLWSAVAAVASIPNAIKSQIMQIKSAFSNLRCVLVNGFSNPLAIYESSDVYGASNCSSTAGGRSSSVFSETNTFESPGPVSTEATVYVSPKASQAIEHIKQSDPIEPVNSVQMAEQVKVMNEGVVVYA